MNGNFIVGKQFSILGLRQEYELAFKIFAVSNGQVNWAVRLGNRARLLIDLNRLNQESAPQLYRYDLWNFKDKTIRICKKPLPMRPNVLIFARKLELVGDMYPFHLI